MYISFLKRVFDILAALSGLIIILPFFIILIPLVSLSNGGPVFFTQVRPGMNGKLFTLIKFKTMNDKRDDSGNFLPDSDRLTNVGRFIRSFSIDELPQLLNILIGDMSFIGPRPLLTKYLSLYNSRQLLRHEVRPGITGWAQINGRNNIDWQERLEMDVWYVNHISFFLDFKIVILTLIKVLKREGINAMDAVTMKPFMGNKE